MYSYVHNNYMKRDGSINWDSFCKETISSVYKKAYNDRRRIDLEIRFGYLTPNWMEIPECMRRNSYQEALTLEFNTGLVKRILKHNEMGYNEYLKAKGQYAA